jgi:multicomponent Na+:H+ antiporter subunit B
MKKKIIALFLIIPIFLLLAFYMEIGDAQSPYTAQEILVENGSINMVAAIVLDYRLFDTFFEVLVFTLAVTGVSYYVKKLPVVSDSDFEKTSITVNVFAPIMFQMIVLVSLYVAVAGHIGPGGGFAAGVILGTGLLGVTFVKPMEDIEKIFIKSKIEKYKIITPFLIAIYGILGIVWGDSFFTNIPLVGQPGKLLSGGAIIILNLLIGFEVFAGTWTILYKFIKHRGML